MYTNQMTGIFKYRVWDTTFAHVLRGELDDDEMSGTLYINSNGEVLMQSDTPLDAKCTPKHTLTKRVEQRMLDATDPHFRQYLYHWYSKCNADVTEAEAKAAVAEAAEAADAADAVKEKKNSRVVVFSELLRDQYPRIHTLRPTTLHIHKDLQTLKDVLARLSKYSILLNTFLKKINVMTPDSDNTIIGLNVPLESGNYESIMGLHLGAAISHNSTIAITVRRRYEKIVDRTYQTICDHYFTESDTQRPFVKRFFDTVNESTFVTLVKSWRDSTKVFLSDIEKDGFVKAKIVYLAKSS